MNWQDDLNRTFTLAHEFGHSLHSYFTRGKQPFIYADYTMFVAEVASTLNEALLTHHLVKQAQADGDKPLRTFAAQLTTPKVFAPRFIARRCSPNLNCAFTTWSKAANALTAEALCALYQRHQRRLLRRRSDSGRLRRYRMGAHPAFLLQLLRLSVLDGHFGGDRIKRTDFRRRRARR